MMTYYELLGIDTTAPPDAVKHAFRRQISRYHPDKVEHLGPEFKEIASTRAAELTEAYRVLIDEESRRRYDDSLRERPLARPEAAPSRRKEHPVPAVDACAGPWHTVSAAEPIIDRETQSVRQNSHECIKREVIGRLRQAIERVNGGIRNEIVAGFDAVFVVGEDSSVFRKSRSELVLLVKIAQAVDATAIRRIWGPALRATARFGDNGCVLLMGSSLAGTSVLSRAVADERRRARRPGPVLVPVDVRDWEALFPPEAPSRLRAILQCLRAGVA